MSLHRRYCVVVGIVLLAGGSWKGVAAAAEPAAEAAATSHLQARRAWTTSRVVGSPEPPPPYRAEQVWPKLSFANPVVLTSMPGSARLFVAELAGKIYSFSSHNDAAAADLVVDLKQHIPGLTQIYGFTFHPDFERNRFVYLCYVLASGQPEGTRVSRFTMHGDPPRIDPSSEKVVITWLSGGHNGGCLKFGPEGYLYISTGDGAGPNPPDPLDTGQDVSDLLSSILRIDVDHAGEKTPYRIPADNPFVQTPNARGEVFAYGFRNPWKMSFDAKSGDLWVGDVGWELWELVFRVQAGGNYGWSVFEGSQAINPAGKRGPTSISPPVVEHAHSEAASITGGFVYRGSLLPELRGAYIYGDYETGKIWGLRYDGDELTWHQELVDTPFRIIAFGEDGQGELYFMHYGGTLHRLVPNEATREPSTFPRQLSETGLFESTVDLTPAAGVVPYEVRVEPWADGADARRWIALPGTSRVQPTNGKWTFPPDTVLVKTLSLELREGDPASRRRLETQLLHFDGEAWHGYAYVWNDEQTDAELVDAAGRALKLSIADPEAPGRQRQQTWQIVSRADCLRCHNTWSGPALGWNSLQLNFARTYAGEPCNQLEALRRQGVLEPADSVEPQPALTPPSEADADLTARARSYLHANCAHCHRMHAGGAVLSQMQYDIPLEKASLVGAAPSQGRFELLDAKVVAPADPFRSVLLYRMSKLGSGRMPHIGSNLVDVRGTQLMRTWIEQLSVEPAEADAKAGESVITRLRAEQHRLLQSLEDAPPEQVDQAISQLLDTTSGALMLVDAIQRGTTPAAKRAIELGVAHPESQVRDLFQRYVPEQDRAQRLGSVVQPQAILALPGDAERGRRLFFQSATVQCKSCHRIGEEGNQLGPELSTIGKKYTPAQLLESILEPSKTIDAKYLTYVLETSDGRLLTGILESRDERQVVLRDAQNKPWRIAADEVELLAPQRASLMPDLLLRDMTAQEVADLLAFLSELRGEE